MFPGDKRKQARQLYDLREFGLTDLIKLSAEIRTITGGSLEDVAGRVVAHLRDHLRDSVEGRPACVLARFYKTHRFAALPPDVQAFTRDRYGETGDDVLCLTLLASTGDERAWNERTDSHDHQAIPLPDPKVIEASPMIRGLIAQLGLEVGDVLNPTGFLVDDTSREFNVFYVPDARDNPLVPAQDFVRQHGVRSVLGFGGLLPSGEIWCVILFTRVPVSREVAEFFRSVALSVSVAAVHTTGQVFREGPTPDPIDEAELLRWRAQALDQLLAVREGAVVWQTEMLQHALVEMDAQSRELEVSRDTLQESEARKAAILDSAMDGVITIDGMGTIVEMNPAAGEVFGLTPAEVIGQSMVDIIVPERLRGDHRKGFARYLETGEGRILNQRIEITGWHSRGIEFPIELTVTRVDLPDVLMFTAYVRDLTGKYIERKRLDDLADALQRALLPVADVSVPHLDVAARYRSAPTFAGDVGGDFYDPFRIIDDVWSVSIGDVCGKGARAAAVTNLVKHGIRSGEHHHLTPADTLREVNTLMMSDPLAIEEGRFCTAAVARLQLEPGRLNAQLALAGHPQPVVVRANGLIELVGIPALPLGMFEDFGTEVTELTLESGDSLVLYTDGVTEARLPHGEVFGDDRLIESLTHTAGRSAEVQVDQLMTRLIEHSAEGSDDTAIVVLKVP